VDRLRSVFGSRVWAALVSGSLIGVLVFAVVMVWRGGRGETIVLQVPPVSDPNVIRVYVGGEVVAPGLYSLQRGSRVAEALDAAGGTTSSGDVAGLGMASTVEDADQIIVPSRQAIAPQPIAPQPIVPFASTGGESSSSSASTAVSQPAAPSIININTASAAELESLPEIGEVLAARIIAYREANGPYQTVDQLEPIDGISQRMIDEIRHLITAGT